MVGQRGSCGDVWGWTLERFDKSEPTSVGVCDSIHGSGEGFPSGLVNPGIPYYRFQYRGALGGGDWLGHRDRL